MSPEKSQDKYCPEAISIRDFKEAFIGSLIVGLFSGLTGYLANGAGLESFMLYGIKAIVLTFSIWMSNLIISNWAQRRYSDNDQMVKRLVVQIVFNTLAAFIIIFIVLSLSNLLYNESIDGIDYYSTIVFTIIITLLINAVYIGQYFFKRWRDGLVQQKELQIAHQRTQLEALRGQLDPHFLFNALTTLSELIYEDQNKASDYVEQLSRVYRYILDHSKSSLIPVASEIRFLKSYVYLLETKYGDAFQVTWPDHLSNYNAEIPVLASQVAMENVVKHNIIDVNHPMKVIIELNDQELRLINELNPRPVTAVLSHGLGLENLSERYSLLMNRRPEIIRGENEFSIILPLKMVEE